MTDPTPHLQRFDSYQQACGEFTFEVPHRFNLASEICRRHPDATTRIALRDVKPGGLNTFTFGGLDFLSDKLAMSLAGSGLECGDRVLLALPPSEAAAVAQLGVLKAAGVVVPVSPSWEVSLIGRALADSRAKFVIADESVRNELGSSASTMPGVNSIYIVRDLRPSAASPTKDFWSEVDRASSDFSAVDTDAQAPAFLFYHLRSDELIGAVHSHGSLICQLAAFEMINNLEVDPHSTWWTGHKWCSVTSVLGMLYPAWWYGCSVVAAAELRDSFTLIEQCEITHAFLGAEDAQQTAQDSNSVGGRYPSRLIVTDAPAPQVPDRGEASAKLSRIYARTEAGVIAASCAPWYSATSGSAGRAIPGRRIEIVDDNCRRLPRGAFGQIAIHTSDPGLVLHYNGPDTMNSEVSQGWFLTGAHGSRNEDGDLFVVKDNR